MSPDVRQFALAILIEDRLERKLVPFDGPLEDAEPPLLLAEPGRPPDLRISRAKVRVPPIAGMRDPSQRVRILHALANHELQAIELFAWALLAFPDAPIAFKRGLVAILHDEQRHLAMYMQRLEALDSRFGAFPVTGHFWNKLEHYSTPLRFVCAMGLTFENANLDFAGEYARAARACGDLATAEVLERVHHDEIAHVHFGWTWMRKLAGEADPWDAFMANTAFPLGPRRARGATFDREARERAGMSEEFIAALEATEPKRPSGESR